MSITDGEKKDKQNREAEIMKHKNIKMKTTAVTLCTVMALGGAATVYAADTVSNVYVVNEFTSDKAGTITDYGDYFSVKNLSTDDTLTKSGEKITVDAPEGKFYYQGNLKKTDIPWKIGIRYFLDGSEISAEDPAGKSGKLNNGFTELSDGAVEMESGTLKFYDKTSDIDTQIKDSIKEALENLRAMITRQSPLHQRKILISDWCSSQSVRTISRNRRQRKPKRRWKPAQVCGIKSQVYSENKKRKNG